MVRLWWSGNASSKAGRLPQSLLRNCTPGTHTRTFIIFNRPPRTAKTCVVLSWISDVLISVNSSYNKRKDCFDMSSDTFIYQWVPLMIIPAEYIQTKAAKYNNLPIAYQQAWCRSAKSTILLIDIDWVSVKQSNCVRSYSRRSQSPSERSTSISVWNIYHLWSFWD